MNCTEMESRLTGLPGGGREEDFSAMEREHLASCPGCREVARREQSLRKKIADAGRASVPGDEYWGSILPRVNARTARRPPSDRLTEWFGSARFVVQGAGVALIVMFLLIVGVTEPPVTGPTTGLATLTGAELLDLSSSVWYTGLLDHSADPAEMNTATIVDLLEEFLAGGDDTGLYASVDPLLVLREVDDTSFGEIVDLLKSK